MVMNPLNEKNSIVLASESPRRRRLLEQAQIAFSVVPSGTDEDAIRGPEPERHAQILAAAKAEAVAKLYPHAWVIGADSIVVIDGRILNKPESAAVAGQMLRRLSGRTHRVITGYSIWCESRGHRHSNVCITEVTFKELTEDEINWYTQTPEPRDKAGGYAIQGIAAFMVKSINGSYTNVVGLPMCEIVGHLTQHGAIRHGTGQTRSPATADAGGKC
ncbi:septum formation protein [Desulfosalsimonas propionicica]|uniref:dTTP/UTP pyrophosphatase n=1 Tax=Desulfosalsimonas propionicica TaxID=332175 RepID=A0A7W0CB37_9BACT|nr:septum formation protein [Desulfosalsimonas propionicica]